jgi:hypothetical protein
MNFDALARQFMRALRGKRSQEQFSRRLGYRTNVAHTWEVGTRWPSAAVVFKALARKGIDVRAGLRRFFRKPPGWLDSVDPVSDVCVAAFLEELRGSMTISAVAARVNKSRFAVARCFSGETVPRLPDFFSLVEACSLRVIDFVALWVDPSSVPEIADRSRFIEAQRRTIYQEPWSTAVLRALELEQYAKLPRHRSSWIAKRIGIPESDVERCLRILSETGQIDWRADRWVPREITTVDTRVNRADEILLKSFWARVGDARLRAGRPGHFAFNVFTISAADLARLYELHQNYYKALRALVAQSTPSERVVVANLQLFALDPEEAASGKDK